MNQADFLVSSPAKVAKPVKASAANGVKNLTQDSADFGSRLEQATGKSKQPVARSKAVETRKEVARTQTTKGAKNDAQGSDKVSTKQELEQVQASENPEASQQTESSSANNDSQQASDVATTEQEALAKQTVNAEVDAINIDKEALLQAEMAQGDAPQAEVIEDAPSLDSTPQQSVIHAKGTVLDEGEEILSQLNSANQMLKPDSAAMQGKELPHLEQNNTSQQALMQSVAQYEAQQAEDMTEFTAALAPTKPLLSQLLEQMNAEQADSDREAYLQQLAAKEGLSNEQLQLLQQAVEKVDITQLQAAIDQDQQQTEVMLSNESAVRDAFVIQILTQGSEDPQLEEILTQLKSDSYQELDTDIEQIPPKLMLELSGYIEAKQVVQQQAEQEQLASDAFLLGTGFGAGLATADLTAQTGAHNATNAPLTNATMLAPELYHQARTAPHKQEIAAWQMLQAQQGHVSELATDDAASLDAKAQMQLPKGARIDAEVFSSSQFAQSSAADKQLLAAASQPQANRGADFATQLAGMSGASSALQDIQQAGARVSQQQAIDTPLKLAQQGQVAPELTNKVNMMLSRDLKQVDIRLDPPELGRVHIKLALNNDQAHLNFTVTHAHARDAIEHSIPRLREMLAQQGVDLGQANVDQEQSQARDFSSMLAGENDTQSSEANESSIAFNGDGDVEEMKLEVTSASLSDSAVDFYA